MTPSARAICFISGLLDGLAIHFAQSFRNHRVGSRCNSAASGPPVYGSDLDQNIFRAALGVFHKDVEITVVVENAGIDKFVLHLITVALPVRQYQVI